MARISSLYFWPLPSMLGIRNSHNIVITFVHLNVALILVSSCFSFRWKIWEHERELFNQCTFMIKIKISRWMYTSCLTVTLLVWGGQDHTNWLIPGTILQWKYWQAKPSTAQGWWLYLCFIIGFWWYSNGIISDLLNGA